MQSLPTFDELKQMSCHSPVVTKPRSTSVIAAAQTQRKVRAAGYCRVSTDHTDQKSSISIQAKHLASTLTSHPDWENAGVYIDIATGTKTEKRPELQRLLKECRAGRVSLVLTKSISRFARNTVDLLEMVRTLTGMGVTLIFEKEHIDTSVMDTEFLLTILASLAADESQSIAANTRWGLQKRFRDGSYRAAVAPYGYDLVDGNYAVNAAEAEVVREIFQSFLDGETMYRIAVSMNDRAIPTKRSGQVWRNGVVGGRWCNTAIRNILTNEAYLGIMVLQKTTKDAAFNTVVNRGQLPMYRIDEHHPAIIDADTFEAVREKLKANKKPQSPKYIHPFSRKVRCGRCGHSFNRCINNIGNASWRCRNHILNPTACPQEGISEGVLEQAFADVAAELRADNTPILDLLNVFQQSHRAAAGELTRIDKRLSEIGNAINADRITERNRLLHRREEIEAETDSEKSQEERQTEELLQIIRSDSSVGFCGDLFLRIIDQVTIHDDITFHFKGGLSISRAINRRRIKRK